LPAGYSGWPSAKRNEHSLEARRKSFVKGFDLEDRIIIIRQTFTEDKKDGVVHRGWI
jgi:hypothetical protein